MADATYQPKVYRDSGGDRFNVVSGGQLNIESGSSFTCATPLEFSAAYYKLPVQTAATSATTIVAYGHTLVTGTTVGPTYLISNPLTGVPKYISLAATSSGVTHRCIIAPASTAVSIDTTGQNQITLATSAARGVTLIGLSTARWACVGVYSVGEALTQRGT